MTRALMAVAAALIDATFIGVSGALLSWALWGGSADRVIFIGVVGGTLTALFIRVRRHRSTLGEAVVSRLRR